MDWENEFDFSDVNFSPFSFDPEADLDDLLDMEEGVPHDWTTYALGDEGLYEDLGANGIPMDEEGDVGDEVLNDLTDVLGEGGNWVYQYTGRNPVQNPFYIGEINGLDDMRQGVLGLDQSEQFFWLINNCPVGHGFRTPYYLRGRSFGEIVDIYNSVRLAKNFPDRLPGMFFRGNLVRFRLSVVPNLKGERSLRSGSYKEVRSFYIPLDRIDSFGDLVNEGSDGIERTLEAVRQSVLEDGLEGSNWNMLIISDDEGQFIRRYDAIPGVLEDDFDTLFNPQRGGLFYSGAAGGRIATAGFSEILGETITFPLSLEDGRKYWVVIPGGSVNCVEECIKASLADIWSKNNWNPYDATRLVESVKGVLKESYVKSRMEKSPDRSRVQVSKEFDRKIFVGYSGKMLRDVKGLWAERGYNLRIMYELERNDGGSRRWVCREVGKDLNRLGRKDVLILRMHLDGRIYRRFLDPPVFDELIDMESGVKCGEVLHALCLLPDANTPPFKIDTDWRRDKVFRDTILEKVEGETRRFMEHMRDRAIGRSLDVTLRDLQKYVFYQDERYRAERTENLFFKKGARASKPQIYYRKRASEMPLIIAFDMETVQLTKEAILAGKVNLKTIGNSEGVDYTTYDPESRQIPYSVQWVPINMSDEGRLIQEKVRTQNQDKILRYPWLGYPSDILKDTWFVAARGKKKIRYGWVMLDSVKTTYGRGQSPADYLLGDCVEAFIQDVGSYAVARGFTKKVIFYGHNAGSFDTIILESFLVNYKVEKRLKTPRGILSLTINFPYLEGVTRKNLKMVFLDTRMFLSFSLARICKDFSVPKEWEKIDFPITLVNWKNCYNEEVMKIGREYGENDVRCLAYIVKLINRMICFSPKETVIEGDEEWMDGEGPSDSAGELSSAELRLQKLKPFSPYSLSPPLTGFVTFMGVVKKMLDIYFDHLKEEQGVDKPMSIDFAPLRSLIDRAKMGGRACPFAKCYMSSYWPKVWMAYMEGKKDLCGELVKAAIESGAFKRILDVTSLYPFATADCFMPTGRLKKMDRVDRCKEIVDAVGCGTCESLMTLCDRHKASLPDSVARPFGIILVKGLVTSDRHSLRHAAGRKLFSDKGGIQYSLENIEEMRERLDGVRDSDGVEVYTNVDLYWLQRNGFVVKEYIGGFEWETTRDLSDLVYGGFGLRAAAKSKNMQCLQLTWKLFLNAIFGVQCQKVIRNKELIVRLPLELKNCSPSNPELVRFITKNHAKGVDPRFIIKDIDHLTNGQSIVKLGMSKEIGEAIRGYSPNHIGCAVLAWSRHIVNLVLYKIGERDCTYTDTDSLAVFGKTYKWLESLYPTVIDESGKRLGSYKNDHADYFPAGTNPVVLFSAIGAKKVKMHIVANSEGEIHVANTYKGFLGQGEDEEGRKYSPEKLAYDQSKALLEILYFGVPSERKGTRWTRDSEMGVRIEKDVLFSPDSRTYLNFCKGFTISSPPGDPEGFVSYNVPFGSTYGTLPLDDCVFYPEVQRDVRGKVVGYNLPEAWHGVLSHEMQGIAFEEMNLFLLRYYKKEHDDWYYSPKGEEERDEYDRLISVFKNLQ